MILNNMCLKEIPLMYKINSVILHYHQRNNFDLLVCNLPCAGRQRRIILIDPNKFTETSNN